MKEIRFKQSQPYGCGVYAIANVLNDETFITNQRIKVSKKGNNLHQLNQWMIKDKKGFIIEPIYLNLVTSLQPIPPKGIDFRPFDNSHVFPFILDVAHSEMGKKHLIGGLAKINGVVILMDSLKEYQFETTWEQLLSGAVYNFIIGIYGFSPKSISKENDWIMLDYDA